jgi:hypothetical protein
MLEHTSISRIISSDLSHLLCMAAVLAVALYVEPRTCRELREIRLGAWEGRSFVEITCRSPAEFKARDEDLEYWRPPGGESFAELRDRVLRSIFGSQALRPQRPWRAVRAPQHALAPAALWRPLTKKMGAGPAPRTCLESWDLAARARLRCATSTTALPIAPPACAPAWKKAFSRPFSGQASAEIGHPACATTPPILVR